MFDIVGSLFPDTQANSGWTNWHPLDDRWYEPRLPESSAGVDVNEHLAMTYAVVYACVAKISKTFATLPRFIYERLDDDAKKPARDHWLFPLLHDAPNPEMDAVSFWDAEMAQTLLWGCGYSELVFNRRTGELAELWPLESWNMKPQRNDAGKIVYEYCPTGEVVPRFLPADRVLRIPGLSFNGIIGLSPIGYQRESIGLGMAGQKFASKMFENGAAIRGVLEHPGPRPMGKNAYNRLKGSFETTYAGWRNAHKTPLLEEGTTYKPIAMSAQDAQYLETRKMQAVEVCGIYDVPPHKIGILIDAIKANIEEQQIQWVVDCIAPWCRRVEAAINQQLLGNDPRYFCSHVIEGLLRGDIEKRYNAFALGRNWGWLTTNDILRLENMNPKEGGDNDRLIPLNMRVEGEPLPEKPAAKPESLAEQMGILLRAVNTIHEVPNVDAVRSLLESASKDNAKAIVDIKSDLAKVDLQLKKFHGGMEAGNEARKVHVGPLLKDAARRVVNKEVKAITTAYKRMAKGGSADAFLAWLDTFYDEQEQFAAEAVGPVVEAVAGGTDAAARAARKYATASLAAIRECVQTAPEKVPDELNQWTRDKAESLAAEWGRMFE